MAAVLPPLEQADLVRIVALTGCAWDGGCTGGCPHCDEETTLVEAAVAFVADYPDREAVASALRRCSEIASGDRDLLRTWAENGLGKLAAYLVPWWTPF